MKTINGTDGDWERIRKSCGNTLQKWDRQSMSSDEDCIAEGFASGHSLEDLIEILREWMPLNDDQLGELKAEYDGLNPWDENKDFADHNLVFLEFEDMLCAS